MNTTHEPPAPTRRVHPWIAPLAVFGLALVALVPTTGDIGLTWDEPSYRYSQLLSEQWWSRLIHEPSAELFDADSLLYYWPYGRFGINFHPPLAGQLNLLTYELFGRWMKDIPARRMSSVLEFAFTLVILYQVLARRYGAWVGGVAAGSLLLMPRLYGDAHIAGTDTPGLLLWAATAIAFWKGLYEPKTRGWRVLVGVLLGLAFVEKMGAVMVALPLVLWLVFGPTLRLIFRRGNAAAWADGLITSLAMLIPLGLAFREIRRLADVFYEIQRSKGVPFESLSLSRVDLFNDHPMSAIPAWILLVPLAVWVVRRGLAWIFPKSKVWGVERPGLEIWTSMLAFAPVVSWLGNPAWWRETLPRLAHYYALNTDRRRALPDIKIMYFGQTYEYSLPWHNAWVLIAITVPVGILVAALIGLLLKLPTVRRDPLPLYFGLNLVILPVLRMLPTPAHDGVRLFLPTFFFLAAFAGWGVVGLADLLGRSGRARLVARSLLTALVLVPAAWGLIRVHPFELSYYNEAIGGPKGAWARGFELSYWYDAFNKETLDALSEKIPAGVGFDSINPLTDSLPTFKCLQELGAFKGSIILGTPDTKRFPSMWILTHDSKATALTRLAFVLSPFYERRPRQLDGLRVVTVLDPKGVGRAWALQLLTDSGIVPTPPEPPAAPAWVRSVAPPLARFWGEGVTRLKLPRVNEPAFTWARTNPATLRAAARVIADRKLFPPDSDAARLESILTLGDQPTRRGKLIDLLRRDPGALLDAIEILIARPDAIRAVLTRYPYTDPSAIGGFLDRNLPEHKQ
jgi:4-amino-4-deoxy-L-arabinose transferase-like glycosyltransferase